MELDREQRLRTLIAKGAKDKPPVARPIALKPRPWQKKPATSPLSAKTVETLLFLCLALVGYNLSILWRALLWLVAGGLLVHLAAFSELVPQHVSSEKRWLAIVLVPLLFAGLCGGTIHQKWLSEHASQMSGILEPEDRKLSPNSDADSAPILEMGDADVPQTDMVPDGTMFKMGGDVIRLTKVHGKVLFTATVRDQSGHTVLQVENNHWVVNGDQQVSWDHNYDDNSLEVLDSGRRVIFQVRLYRDGARVQAEWFRNNTFGETGRYSKDVGFQPLFKYPSDLYWSQRTGDYEY